MNKNFLNYWILSHSFMKKELNIILLFLFIVFIRIACSEDVRGTDSKILERYPHSIRIEYEFFNEAEEYYQNIKSIGPTYYIAYVSSDGLDKIKNYYNNYFLKYQWEIIFFEESNNGDKWIVYLSKDNKNYFAEVQTSLYDEELSTNKISYRITEETIPSFDISPPVLKENLIKTNKISIPNVLFYFNSAKLKESGKLLLKNITDLIKDYKNYAIKIIVHSDAIGSEEKLNKITQSQAEAIKKYILSLYPFSENKLTAIGKGSKEPLTEKLTPEDRFLNKRIEFIIDKTQ